ncbi:hypothetical protein [Nostoc sp.]|uniref:hypothetical protein n=1 Tax=Nostoc sp. TaxID=1180 RepID=UPI002FF7FF27
MRSGILRQLVSGNVRKGATRLEEFSQVESPAVWAGWRLERTGVKWRQTRKGQVGEPSWAQWLPDALFFNLNFC